MEELEVSLYCDNLIHLFFQIDNYQIQALVYIILTVDFE